MPSRFGAPEGAVSGSSSSQLYLTFRVHGRAGFGTTKYATSRFSYGFTLVVNVSPPVLSSRLEEPVKSIVNDTRLYLAQSSSYVRELVVLAAWGARDVWGGGQCSHIWGVVGVCLMSSRYLMSLRSKAVKSRWHISIVASIPLCSN